jgi:plasmid stabilization system protein ParE
MRLRYALPALATPYSYLIFYEVTDDEIIIHAVCHGARDPSDNPRFG